jgi:hypothetical protein
VDVVARGVLVAASVLALPACVYDLGTFNLCDRDPEVCAVDPAAWPVLPACTRKGALVAQLGTGDVEFVVLAPGESPVLHAGSGLQGADVRHLNLGVRIANPDPAGSRFKVALRAVELEPDAKPNAPGPTRTAVLNLVLGRSLVQGADGSVSCGGIRMFVGGAPLALSLDVLDECGRSAHEDHPIH